MHYELSKNLRQGKAHLFYVSTFVETSTNFPSLLWPNSIDRPGKRSFDRKQRVFGTSSELRIPIPHVAGVIITSLGLGTCTMCAACHGAGAACHGNSANFLLMCARRSCLPLSIAPCHNSFGYGGLRRQVGFKVIFERADSILGATALETRPRPPGQRLSLVCFSQEYLPFFNRPLCPCATITSMCAGS